MSRETPEITLGVHEDPYDGEKGEAPSKPQNPVIKCHKELMHDLEGQAKKEHYISIIKSGAVHLSVLLVFIFLLVVTRILHKINNQHFLHMRIHGWVGLLMVIVCGYPFIRFTTFVVSEPFVLPWKMIRYTMFFADPLRKNITVILWFILVLCVWCTGFRSDVVKDNRGAKTLHISLDQYNDALKTAVKQVTSLLLALTAVALFWALKNVLYLKLRADLHYDLFINLRNAILYLHFIQYITKEKRSWDFLKVDINERENKNNSAGNGRQDVDMSFWKLVWKMKQETVPVWILERLTETYMKNMEKMKPMTLKGLEKYMDDEGKLKEEAEKMFEKVNGQQQSKNPKEIREKLVDFIGLQKKNDRRGYTRQKEEEEEEDDICYIFKLFDREEKMGEISEDEFLRWAVKSFTSCLGLERTIKSTQSVFLKLNILMSVCVIVLGVVIWLLLSQIVTTAQLAVLLAPFLSATFTFSDSLKDIIAGLIFVFTVHPFDVGNRVKVDNKEMRVKEIHIVKTVFVEYETGVQVVFPNSMLTKKSIINLDNSPDQPMHINFSIPIETREKLIKDMQVRIRKTLDDDVTYTSPSTVAKEEISKEEIKLVVYFKYLVPNLSFETIKLHRSDIFNTIIRLRNEMKEMESKIKDCSEKDLIPFQFNNNVKLKTIEEKIMHTLKRHDQSLSDCSQSLSDCSQPIFTGIDDKKEKITLDLHMRCRAGVFKTGDDKLEWIKNEIKKQVEGEEA